MNNEIRYIKESEYHEWDDFVHNHPDGSVFHCSYWLKNLFDSLSAKIEFRIICIFDKNGNILGGFAFGIKKAGGILSILFPPPNTLYWNILVSSRDTKYQGKNISYKRELIQSILNIMEDDLDIINFIVPNSTFDIRPYTWKGYFQKVLYTYILKIDDLDSTYDLFDPSLKRQIKKGERSNYNINSGNNQDLAETFLKLQSLSFDRQSKSFSFQEKNFLKFIASIRDIVNLQFYIIYQENKPVYGISLLIDKNIAYYWLAGGDPDFFDTGLNQLLLWNIIKDLKEKDIKYFDFVGTNTESITNYKSKYNFTLTPYYALSKQVGWKAKSLMFLKNLKK